MSDMDKIIRDALLHGSGVARDGAHVPVDEFYKSGREERIEAMARALCAHRGRAWGALSFDLREELIAEATAAYDTLERECRADRPFVIARAILAERERCAMVAETFAGSRGIPAYPIVDVDGEVVAYTKPSTGRRYADPVRIAAAIRKGE